MANNYLDRPFITCIFLHVCAGALYTNAMINYNANEPQVYLVVTARDGGIPSLSASVVVVVKLIDINSHAPVFNQSSYRYCQH